MCPPESPFPISKGIVGKKKNPNSLQPFSDEQPVGAPAIPKVNSEPKAIVKGKGKKQGR